MKVVARQEINLFNEAFAPQKKILTASRMGVALLLLGAGIGVLAIALGAQTARMQAEADAGAARLAGKQARFASASSAFAPRQKNPAVTAELAEAEAQLAALRMVSGILERGGLGDTDGFSGVFKAFARQSDPGLWLTGITIVGRDIGIRGRSTDAAAVPGYIGRLTREPLLQGRSFASLQIGQAEPVQVVGADGKTASAPAPYVEFSLQSMTQGPRP